MERIPTQHSKSSGILFHSTVFHIALSGSSTTRNSDHVEQCARSGLQNAERTSGVGESRPRVRRAACVPLRAQQASLCSGASKRILLLYPQCNSATKNNKRGNTAERVRASRGAAQGAECDPKAWCQLATAPAQQKKKIQP